jgi:hypothetical protein
MSSNFCRALQDDDRAALKAALDPVLAGAAGGKDERLRALKAWLETQACVASVEISPDLLDSEPPIQELIVTLGTGARKTIGIRLDPKRLSVNYKP